MKRTTIALIPPMSRAEFERAVDRLGFSRHGVASFFGRDARTVRRWAAAGPIPAEVALALRLMIRFKVSVPNGCRQMEGS